METAEMVSASPFAVFACAAVAVIDEKKEKLEGKISYFSTSELPDLSEMLRDGESVTLNQVTS